MMKVKFKQTKSQVLFPSIEKKCNLKLNLISEIWSSPNILKKYVFCKEKQILAAMS